MVVRIVRLGSPRATGEGTRIGTVRRPPRGVPKSQYAAQNWYDVWFPNLAPSLATMKQGQSAKTPAQWAKFLRQYRSEMATPPNKHALALLAALSHRSNFSVGCYCEDESRCHRSVLRKVSFHSLRGFCPVRPTEARRLWTVAAFRADSTFFRTAAESRR